MPRPRFTTSQLILITTLAALIAGLFTSAWKWQPVWALADVTHSPPTETASPIEHFWVKEIYVDAIPITVRIVPIAAFIMSFTLWATLWGIVSKRVRESLARNGNETSSGNARKRIPTPSIPAPLALKLCWGLMIIGGLVALGIPIMLMFMIGPWLFPTQYFSLFVGLAAVARGAALDTLNLKRTAALQMANMISLDFANIVFAAMEFALLQSRSVREYLGA